MENGFVRVTMPAGALGTVSGTRSLADIAAKRPQVIGAGPAVTYEPLP